MTDSNAVLMRQQPPTWLCHIGGVSRAAVDGKVFAVDDPATGGPIATVADASVDDARRAVDAAADAFGDWTIRAPRDRADLLQRAYGLVLDHRDELAHLIVSENGKPLSEAHSEVSYAAEFFRWYAEEAVRVAGTLGTAPNGSGKMLVLHQGVGVALLITPWNLPLAMATRKIAPALAAGCTVVLKPAPETPLCALRLAELLDDAGFPDGVVNVLPTTDGPGTVNAILDDPRVRKLSFTGSTEVGRILLSKAAQRIVNCSMELGGNAPFIVFADADIDAAVEGALTAKVRHNGQACTAANRFYVEAPVAEAFTDRLVHAMAELKVGHGMDPSVHIGPLISQSACDDVERLVSIAVDDGATIRVGGKRGTSRGHFYEPTVIADVPADSKILEEEIFAPVAPIVSFDTGDDVVRLANDTEHGLVGYVFTSDLGRALRVAEQLEAGMVGINKGVVSEPAAPFGGVKASGLGREGGSDGILAFTETKYVAVSW